MLSASHSHSSCSSGVNRVALRAAANRSKRRTATFVRCLARSQDLPQAARSHQLETEFSEPASQPSQGNGDSGRSGGGNADFKTGEDDWNYDGWNPLLRLYFGFNSRLHADSMFTYKLAVECGIDAIIIAFVNVLARGDNFVSEIEFVLCQMLVSCSNDFALVYLLAPTMQRRQQAAGRLGRFLNNLPSHVMATGAFTPLQRIACFGSKMIQYGICGFVMGVFGSTVVNKLTDYRELHDEAFEPPPEAPSVLLTGLGWLFFMGVNSNVRYNLVAWAEQYLYSAHPGSLSKLGSVALRFTNNFAGAYQYVDLADEIGISQPRKSLREERRLREIRERRARWMWWRKPEPEPKKWPFSLLQS